MAQFKRGETMKISNKLRYFSCIALMLLCFSVANISISADEAEQYVAEDGYSEIPGMELETQAQDEKTYLDGMLKQSDVEQQVQNYSQMIASLLEFSDEEIALVKEQYSGQTGYEGLFDTFDTLKEKNLGKFKNLDPESIQVIEVDKSVADVLFDMEFEKEKITIDLKLGCYKNLGTIVKSVAIGDKKNAERMKDSGKEPSFGEKMSQAGANTLMGMGTVFCVLIFMSLIISCFGVIPKIMDSMNGKNKKTADAVAQTPEAVEISNVDDGIDQGELIAVITAAIVASEQKATDSFVVRSIKRR
ncbi:MAG: OadG family protein [Eubacterium sp.]|nr:OadG family protein [Eubacterium sp.]